MSNVFEGCRVSMKSNKHHRAKRRTVGHLFIVVRFWWLCFFVPAAILQGLRRRHLHLQTVVSWWRRVILLGPLWGESTGHQWIPITKGQACGALMSSWLLVWISCWYAVEWKCHLTHCSCFEVFLFYIDGLVQERRDLVAKALELGLFFT